MSKNDNEEILGELVEFLPDGNHFRTPEYLDYEDPDAKAEGRSAFVIESLLIAGLLGKFNELAHPMRRFLINNEEPVTSDDNRVVPMKKSSK